MSKLSYSECFEMALKGQDLILESLPNLLLGQLYWSDIFRTRIIDQFGEEEAEEIGNLESESPKTDCYFVAHVKMGYTSCYTTFYVPLQYYDTYRKIFNNDNLQILQLKDQMNELTKRIGTLEHDSMISSNNTICENENSVIENTNSTKNVIENTNSTKNVINNTNTIEINSNDSYYKINKKRFKFIKLDKDESVQKNILKCIENNIIVQRQIRNIFMLNSLPVPSFKVIKRILQSRETKDIKKGRPKIISKNIEEFLVNYVSKNGDLSLKFLRKVIFKKFKKLISTPTISRVLKRNDFCYKKQNCDIKLTERQIEKRKCFIKQQIRRISTERKRILENKEIKKRRIVFSDESRLCAKSDGRQKIWVKKGPQEEENTWHVDKYGGGIMVWGAISYNFKSDLLLCPTRLNSDNYIDLLESSGFITKLKNLRGKILFMQDNAPAHVSFKTRHFFEHHKISLLQNWPPNSPDLNPIETLWSVLKRRIKWKENMTNQELFDEANRVWKSISQVTINLLVRSFERRIFACAKNKFRSISEIFKNHKY